MDEEAPSPSSILSCKINKLFDLLSKPVFTENTLALASPGLCPEDPKEQGWDPRGEGHIIQPTLLLCLEMWHMMAEEDRQGSSHSSQKLWLDPQYCPNLILGTINVFLSLSVRRQSSNGPWVNGMG